MESHKPKHFNHISYTVFLWGTGDITVNTQGVAINSSSRWDTSASAFSLVMFSVACRCNFLPPLQSLSKDFEAGGGQHSHHCCTLHPPDSEVNCSSHSHPIISLLEVRIKPQRREALAGYANIDSSWILGINFDQKHHSQPSISYAGL